MVENCYILINMRAINKTQSKEKKMTKSNTSYRIQTVDNKIKFAGTDKGSWFNTLEDAKKEADNNDSIYEYENCVKMWEIL